MPLRSVPAKLSVFLLPAFSAAKEKNLFSVSSESGLLLSSLYLHISTLIREKITIKGTGVTEGARRATGVSPVRAMQSTP